MNETQASVAAHADALSTLVAQGSVKAAAALRQFEQVLADKPFNLDVSQARCSLPDNTVHLLLVLPTVACDPAILEKQSRGKATKAAQSWRISTQHLLFLVARDCSNQGKPFFTRLFDFASRCPDRRAAFNLLCECVAHRRANTQVKRQGLRRQKRGITLDDVVAATRTLKSLEPDTQSGSSPSSTTPTTPPTPDPEASRAPASSTSVSQPEVSISRLSFSDSSAQGTPKATAETEQQPPDSSDPFELADDENDEPGANSSSRPGESFGNTGDEGSKLNNVSSDRYLEEGQDFDRFSDFEDDFGRFVNFGESPEAEQDLSQSNEFDADPEPSKDGQEVNCASAAMGPDSSHTGGLSFLKCAVSRGKHGISGPSSPSPTKKPRLEFAVEEVNEVINNMLDGDAKLLPKLLDAVLEKLIQACSQRAFMIRSSEVQAMLKDGYIPQSDIREAIAAEKILILPLSLDNGQHWALAVMRPRNNTLATTDFYDSSTSELHLKEAKRATSGFLQHYFGDSLRLSSRGVFPCAAPVQDSEADSGVITFACAFHILAQRPLPARAPIMLWRFVMADYLDLSRQEEDGLDWDTLLPDDDSETSSAPPPPEPSEDEDERSPLASLAAMKEKHRRLERSLETRLRKMYQSRTEKIEPVRNDAVAVLAVLTTVYSNASAEISSWAVEGLTGYQKDKKPAFEEARQSYERLGVTLRHV